MIRTFLEGFASFISPCLLPMLPVYAMYFAAADRSTARTALRALAFVLGFSAVFIALGVFAGSLGAALAAHRTAVVRTCGALVMLIGLGYAGLFRLPAFAGRGRAVKVTGVVSAFVFGLVFSLALTPCVGAFLAAALLEAATDGTALAGAAKLAAYSAGLGIPLFVSALLIDKLKGAFAMVKSNYRAVNLVCGLLLVVTGALMAADLKPPASASAEVPPPPAATNAAPASAASATNAAVEVVLTEANFEREVLQAKLPVVVDFWAPWCGPCRRLAPTIAALARERAGEVKVCKANVDECEALAQRYGIRGIPAVFLFRDGKVSAKSVGLKTKDQLERGLGLEEVK